MTVQDARDWVVMGIVTAIIAAATRFLFTHAVPMNFCTWAGVVTTVCGIYHFLIVSDDKRPDAH